MTVQERNELMTESLKVQREWGQSPERSQIVNMATEGEASVMGKPELTALRQEVGIYQSKPGHSFVGKKDGANTVINEMKGNDIVNSYIVSRDTKGKAYIAEKVLYENGKATDKIEYVHDENGNVIKEIHKGDNLTKEILKDAEGNVLGSDEYVYDSQGLQRTIHKNAQGKIVAIYDNVNKQMVFDIREKSVNNNVQADSKPESQKPAESLPDDWEIPENNMTTFRRNKNAVTDVKNINPEDVSVAGTYNGYSHFAGPTEKSLGVNGDIRSLATKNKGLAVAYDKAKNVTVITTGVCDAFNRPGGIISIKVKGQVSEADGIALVKNLEKANFIPERMSTIETPQELGVLGRRIQQETAKFFNEKQTNSALDTKAPTEESRVTEKSATENPVNASENEAIQPKQKPVETPAEPRFSESNKATPEQVAHEMDNFAIWSSNNFEQPVFIGRHSGEASNVAHFSMKYSVDTGKSVKYFPDKDISLIEYAKTKESSNRGGMFRIAVKGKVSEADAKALMEHLFDKGVIKRDANGYLLTESALKRGNEQKIAEATAEFLVNKKLNSQNSTGNPELVSGIEQQVKHNVGEESQVKETSTVNDKNPVIASEGKSETKAPETDSARHSELESESSQPATDKSVVAEESRVTTETPQKTEHTPVNASESEANQIKPETKATETKSDKSTGEKSQVKIEQKNNKEFSTSDIPVELSEMEEYVKNSNVVEFPENENTYTYSIKNDKTGKLMYVRFNNKNSKRSSITIVEANKQEQHIEFTKDGENPTKVTYKDADGNIIKYAEYEYNKNNQITKGTERNADGSLKGSSEYEYDGNDKLVKLTNKDADGKVIESRELKYNDAGKLTEQIEKDAEGKITGVFDGDGNPLKFSTEETPVTNGQNPVVGENETPKFEEVETNEGLQLRHKVGDENSYEFFNPETLKREPTTKQFFDERVARDGVKAKPVEKTIGESATGNTQKKAEQTYKEEMNNVELTSTAQVKNLEKYDIMFQSKEGKALLDKAKKDPNFGKTVEERVPSDKIVKDADGNIQSIEIDGVTYTRNEQGEYVNEKGDSQIQIETPDQDIPIIDPKVDKRIIIDKENNKILRINSDDMTIEYDSNGQPERVSSLGNTIYLSTGNYSPDYGDINVDPTGRVIKNDAFFIDINGRKYYPNKQEGYRYSDWGENAKGESIDYKIRKETEDSLSKQIEDAQLETKKAYDDVRNQIEDAYNNSKIDRNAADNLHAELNKKAKANGLETQETPTMKAEREALAKWNEQVDALKNNLMSEIEKVDSQATHDQMVEKIGETCKNGEIDMKRANELYDALKAKAESLGNVESLAKKAERINKELKAHEIKSADEVAETKPSKISMFDRLFHRNKARLEKEVARGEETIGDYKFNTVKDENGYVRTKTNNTGKIEGKEYFNAKGKKIKTEEYNAAESLAKVTEGNVTTEYNADGTINNIDYPHNKNVEFTYDENGNLIGAEFYEWHNSLHPKNWNDSEFSATKRCTNYKYNSDSDKPHFELVDENGKVVTDKNGKPVGTATFDPETRHWVEDGQYSSDLAPKTTNVSRGEGRFRIKLPERNKVPKNLRDENGKLREGVTQNDKGYIESITKDEVVTTKNYDSKGTLVSETTENLTTYYNKNGKVIYTEEKLPGDKGVKITEKTKDYDLEIIEKDGSLKIIHHTKNENGTAKGTEEFKYSEKNKVYENTSPEGNVLKTVAYDVKNHSWTIRDGEGKKLDSQNNMKESHIKRNIGIGAGVLALGGIVYGFATSGDDKDVEQSAKAIAEQTAKAIAEQAAKVKAEQAANAKAETKVTLGDKEGTIAEDGTLTLDGKPYPKDTDGTYTIGDKKYKVENGKLVEVVDTPDDNGETGGAAPDESPEVKGTVDGKEYTINSDGSATIGGHMYEKESDGYYHTEDGSIYGIGEDGKLVKIDKTQTGSDGSQAGSAGSATQTGSDSAQSGNTGATSQQTGNTNTTGNNTHVTAPAQPADSSVSTRTTGTTHNDTSVTTRHTNVPAEESRVNSTRPSERSEESRHTGNTPETGVTEPTEEQMQVAKTLQDEISSISTQADVKAFFAKAISAYNAGKITLMQLDVLKTQVENYVETLNEAIKIQEEQDAIQKPEFGLGGVTTPQEPQPKEKQEITPVERMELTESIRKAKNKEDIAKIQREMRKYKVFQGRKNLRRAYKAKLRAIKHQDESNADKYDKKFEKRMDKIKNSKVYEQDTKEILINNEFKIDKIDKKMWDSENFYT